MLTLAELRALPLPAATFDESGAEIARTPEWRGRGASGVPFAYEGYTVVVAADEDDPRSGAAAAVVERLIDALGGAGATLDRARRLRLEVLAEGMRIASGRVATGAGRSDDVVAHLEAALSARSDVRLRVRSDGAHAVAAPAAIACALLQIAVNAGVHAGAREVELEINGRGDGGALTFRLQWAGAPPPLERLPTSRAQRRADRTGLLAARVFADAVGATMTGLLPGIDARSGANDPYRTRMEIALPSTDLALPLARIADGAVAWSTRTWVEETGMAVGASMNSEVARLVAAAMADPARVVAGTDLRARASGGAVWVAQPPDGALDRSIMAARLIEHERALAAAPPPHEQRLRSLALLLLHLLGDELPWVTGDRWTTGITEALSATGVTAPMVTLDAERVVSPMICAYLMSEYGERFVSDGGELALTVREAVRDDPLVRALARGGDRIELTPGSR